MGTKRFTAEEEPMRARDLVEFVGERVWGGSWQTPMAEALKLPRARVAQWMLVPSEKKTVNVPAKPVPAWVMEALPAIAREGAARLRKDADELDALFPDQGAPPAQGEPDGEEDGPQESGPAASAVASASAEEFEDGFDLHGFLDQVHSEPPRDLGVMPMPAPVPPRRFYSSTVGWVTR